MLPSFESEGMEQSVGTKGAAVARLGLEAKATPLAVVKELAGIRRHGFGLLMSTRRAREGRLQIHEFLLPAVFRNPAAPPPRRARTVRPSREKTNSARTGPVGGEGGIVQPAEHSRLRRRN